VKNLEHCSLTEQKRISELILFDWSGMSTLSFNWKVKLSKAFSTYFARLYLSVELAK